MSKDGNANPTPHSEKELDLTNADRGVWLVKVPKYIATQWERAPDNMNVGKIRINKIPGKDAQVSLTLSDEVVNLDPNSKTKIPRDHKLIVSTAPQQKLGVFSQVMLPPTTETAENLLEEEKLFMEGTIVQKLECRPIADKTYMDMKLQTIKNAAQPLKRVQAIDKVVHNFKPVNDHKQHNHNIDFCGTKAAANKKLIRKDKNAVLDMLFNAFEKHQYYAIKDLVKITKQPIAYLKQILKEVGDYNVQNPHRNMWELKKEYRHYNVDEETGDQGKSNTNTDSD